MVKSLQGMLQVCEAYAAKHNLTFSTDPNPQKCKTKCLKFQKKIVEVKPLKLCGDYLFWVTNVKHLGNYLEDKGPCNGN